MKHAKMPFSVLVCGLLLIAPLAGHSQPPGDFPHGGHGPHPWGGAGAFAGKKLPPYLHGLKLSSEQEARIGEIMKTQGAGLRDKMEEGRKAHDDLRQLSFSADYSDEKAKALAEAAVPRMVERAVLHAQLDHAIFNVLTAEQQKQAKENMERFRERFPAP